MNTSWERTCSICTCLLHVYVCMFVKLDQCLAPWSILGESFTFHVMVQCSTVLMNNGTHTLYLLSLRLFCHTRDFQSPLYGVLRYIVPFVATYVSDKMLLQRFHNFLDRINLIISMSTTSHHLSCCIKNLQLISPLAHTPRVVLLLPPNLPWKPH